MWYLLSKCLNTGFYHPNAQITKTEVLYINRLIHFPYQILMSFSFYGERQSFPWPLVYQYSYWFWAVPSSIWNQRVNVKGVEIKVLPECLPPTKICGIWQESDCGGEREWTSNVRLLLCPGMAVATLFWRITPPLHPPPPEAPLPTGEWSWFRRSRPFRASKVSSKKLNEHFWVQFFK